MVAGRAGKTLLELPPLKERAGEGDRKALAKELETMLSLRSPL